METFFNTYLPWGIVAVTVVVCFYVNIIDAGRRRESNTPYDNTGYGSKKLESALLIGILIGAMLCYIGVPLPLPWGAAIGAVGGLAAGLFRRKKGK